MECVLLTQKHNDGVIQGTIYVINLYIHVKHSERCIEEYYADPNAENAAVDVIRSILIAMSQDGHMLIPVEASESAMKAFDPSKIRVGEEIVLEEDIHWKIVTFTNAEGKTGMPMFTSHEKMNEAGLEGCSALSEFIDSYMESVAGMKDTLGIIINPGERGFLLDHELIGMILEHHRQEKTRQHTPGPDAHFIKPENVPEGFTEVIAEFVKNSLDEVEKVWFTGILDGGEKSWCFAVKADTDDMQHLYDRLHTMMVMMKVQMPVDYMASEDTPHPGAELIYDKEGR